MIKAWRLALNSLFTKYKNLDLVLTTFGVHNNVAVGYGDGAVINDHST